MLDLQSLVGNDGFTLLTAALTAGTTLCLEWTPPDHEFGRGLFGVNSLSYGDPRGDLLVRLRITDQTGITFAKGDFREHILSDCQKTLHGVQCWGEHVIAVVSDAGIFLLDCRDSRSLYLTGPNYQGECYGEYHAATFILGPLFCQEIRLSSNGTVLIFGTNNRAVHVVDEYGFGTTTNVALPEGDIVDARFLTTDIMVLLGSSCEFAVHCFSSNDTRVWRLPTRPKSMALNCEQHLVVECEAGTLTIDPLTPNLPAFVRQPSPPYVEPKTVTTATRKNGILGWFRRLLD
jgi:hypothetical protein